jgi:hypothetical protein
VQYLSAKFKFWSGSVSGPALGRATLFFAGLLAIATLLNSLGGGLKLAPVCIATSANQSCSSTLLSGSNANTAQPAQKFVLDFSQHAFAVNSGSVSNQSLHASNTVNNKSPPLNV